MARGNSRRVSDVAAALRETHGLGPHVSGWTLSSKLQLRLDPQLKFTRGAALDGAVIRYEAQHPASDWLILVEACRFELRCWGRCDDELTARTLARVLNAAVCRPLSVAQTARKAGPGLGLVGPGLCAVRPPVAPAVGSDASARPAPPPTLALLPRRQL